METIGDAYCVAGGLHKESDTHAVQIALMALKMMELSDEVMSPHGEPIKVRQVNYYCQESSCFPIGTKRRVLLQGTVSRIFRKTLERV